MKNTIKSLAFLGLVGVLGCSVDRKSISLEPTAEVQYRLPSGSAYDTSGKYQGWEIKPLEDMPETDKIEVKGRIGGFNGFGE